MSTTTTISTACQHDAICPNTAVALWTIPGIPGAQLRFCADHAEPALHNGHEVLPIGPDETDCPDCLGGGLDAKGRWQCERCSGAGVIPTRDLTNNEVAVLIGL